jgi:hypothetical protein
MCLGGGLQWKELFQFLGDDLLEGRCDRSLFDVDFLSGQVLELLDRLGERFQAGGLAGRKERDLKAGLLVNGVREAGSW